MRTRELEDLAASTPRRLPARFATRTAVAAVTAIAATIAAVAIAAVTIATVTIAAVAEASVAPLFARTGLRLVHAHGAPVEFVSVEGVDGGLGLGGVGHRHEAEPLAATGHAISHDTNGGNFAIRRERRFQPIVSRRVREVTNIDFHLILSLFSLLPAGEDTRLHLTNMRMIPIFPVARQ